MKNLLVNLLGEEKNLDFSKILPYTTNNTITLDYGTANGGDWLRFSVALMKRKWFYIRIKDKFLLKIWTISDNKCSITCYEQSINWDLIEIKEALIPILAQAWITENDILEAIKINLENPFIEWEKNKTDTNKKVNEII